MEAAAAAVVKEDGAEVEEAEEEEMSYERNWRGNEGLVQRLEGEVEVEES